MNNLNCEYVREVYPDVLHGKVTAGTSATVRAHIAHCAGCREEAELIERLHRVQVTLPAGSHERVFARLAQQPRVRWLPRYVALAAMLAAALMGGPVLLESLREPDGGSGSAAPTAAAGLGVVTVEAAMVTGAVSLQDLTVEELEQLLGEIES